MASCGKKANSESKGMKGMSVQELKVKIKLLYPYLTYVNTMKRQELCELLARDCPRLGGLINKNNSCYLDSTLVALFHTINPYIASQVLDKDLGYDDEQLQEHATGIQRVLRGVNTAIRDGKKGACSMLRQSIQRFDKRYSIVKGQVEPLDWKTAQLEPGDVIKLLIRVFEIPMDCEYTTKRYTLIKRKKVFVNETTDTGTFADPSITSDMLYGKKVIELKGMMPEEVSRVQFDDDNKWKPAPGVEYKIKISVKTYTKAPMLSIHVNRVYEDTKLKTAVVPEMAIKLKDNSKPLHLRSILVHHGNTPEHGHYTCYIRCQKYWYEYDDLGFKKLDFVGDQMKLFNFNKSYILKNAVNYIYW